jgi:hypothetical protein
MDREFATLLPQLLGYTSLGYPIFPLVPCTKRPATPRGLHDATTDEDEITTRWTANPRANVGLATAGLLVLDVDGVENPWLASLGESERRDLDRAPAQRTANGGVHFFFRTPDGVDLRSTTGRVAPQVDTRATGGYVVVPPSRLDEERGYHWLPGRELDVERDRLPEAPAWLIELTQDPRSRARSAGVASRAPSPEIDPRRGSDEKIPEGRRNSSLARLAGVLRRHGSSEKEIAALLLLRNADACEPPLDEDEVRAIARSVARYEPDPIATAFAEQPAPDETDAADPADPSIHRAVVHGSEDELLADLPLDPGPFPQDLLEVPGLLGAIVRHNLETAHRPQPILALGAAITLVATITGRKIMDETRVCTNLYVIGVCRSGGGKERARQINAEILERSGLEGMLGPEGFASHTGLVRCVERNPVILFQVDEFGRILATLKDSKRAPHLYHVPTVILRLYSAVGGTFRGDAFAELEKNLVIEWPHASIYATTVPSVFYESLTRENLTDGLLSRFLVFESETHTPPRSDPRVLMRAVPDEILSEVGRWRDTLSPARVGKKRAPELVDPKVLPPTEAARSVLAAHDAMVDRELESSAEETSLWVRASESTRKLALIHAASLHGPSVSEIGEDSMRWAVRLSEYLVRRLVWTSREWLTEGFYESSRARILRFIRSKGSAGVTLSDLARTFRGIRSRDRAEILDHLLEARELMEARLFQAKGAGRPIRIYRARVLEGSPAS